MKKRVLIALLGVLVVVGVLAGIKALQINKMIDQAAGFQPPPETVTAIPVAADSWETRLTAVGSLSAFQGVTVTAELSGKVVKIAFEAGMPVAAGDLLVHQDTSAEQALLPGAEAAVVLARSILDRFRALLVDAAVSQAEVDAAMARHLQAVAEVANLRANIAKKNIRAPFAGQLGIRQVNLGQMLETGDKIVTLQALDPIYVDFLVPQHQLSLLRSGLKVRVTTDAMPGQVLEGKITTINPEVETATRNIRVQGMIGNADEWLRPGMYVDVEVVMPEHKEVLAIPATAVLYAPYSDSVFVVEDAADLHSQTAEGPLSGKVLRQQFVRLGEKRGDFVEVVSGLQAGEMVVSSGVFKLHNKQAVAIDNTLQPEFKLQPEPEDR